MENYLSIGEVAKIRNIDVQSLRYYEKLGILIPAYINLQTGYRYYSMEQLMILDTAILCIDLGIPLKRLKEYVDSDGQLEFERLLRDGKKIGWSSCFFSAWDVFYLFRWKVSGYKNVPGSSQGQF